MTSNDNIEDRDIAVIGAGLAGAVFAHRMIASGYNVTVFDKSRGTGGRHASSRIGNTSVDLGAPFFDSKDSKFCEWLQSLPNLARWQPMITDFEGTPTTTQTLFTAIPRQSALTRSLLQRATLKTCTRVKYIWPETKGVIVRDEAGVALGYFGKVIVATPAPQAAHLLEASPNFAQKAASIETMATWMLILTLNKPSRIKASVLHGSHPALSRVVKDSAKPERNVSTHPEIWTIEANADWSEQYINADPDTVRNKLQDAFQALTDTPLDIAETRVHRWLYGRHRSKTSKTYLWSDASSIGVCGDWLHGSGTAMIANSECAWRSANELADHIIACDKQHD